MIFTKPTWKRIFSVVVILIFSQTLFFKFTSSPETVHIFHTISEWMRGNFLSFQADFFDAYGAYVTGVAELIAVLIILLALFFPSRFPWSQKVGSFFAFNLMAGAIFFHLVTPLGIIVLEDGGLLFGMSCISAIFSLLIFLL